MTTDKKIQIVIIGGGAAGLQLARRLGVRYGRKRHDIILIDRNRTHVWKPLLHEVATGSLDASMDEIGYRSHCHRWGYRYLNGTLDGIDRQARRVHLAPVQDAKGREVAGAHSVRYDYLVLAYGSVANDFGTPGVAEHCLFLDNRSQADAFRDQLLDHCLRVSRTAPGDPSARVRVAIVGGGATGVELAAALYDAVDGLSYYGLEVFDRHRLEVTLLEAGPRILPALSDRLAAAARSELEALGVNVIEGAAVSSAAAGQLTTADGPPVAADLLVWAAGVRAVPIRSGLDGMELTRNGQVVVRPTLQSVSDARIFAIGDCASYLLPGRDRPVPPRAQAAHQMASAAYANLNCLMAGKPLRDFAYRDHGSLVSLSRFSTVGSLMGNLVGGQLAVEGRVARFVYLSLYRIHLIAVHGLMRGTAFILLRRLNRFVRPQLKLH